MKTSKQFFYLTIQMLALTGCASTNELEGQQYVTKRISEEIHCPTSELSIGARQESVQLSRSYTWNVSCKNRKFVCFDTRGSWFCHEVLKENFKKPKIMPFSDKDKKDGLN